MSQKTTDFISSFGIMLVGLVLLFVGSVLFGKVPNNPSRAYFPTSGPRVVFAGGDVALPALPNARPRVPLPVGKGEFSGNLSAASALVLDDNTGEVLFKKNTSVVRPLASITKLMSALVLLDLPINWSATATVQEADVDTSSHHINVGEIYILDDLWHVALIGSSNSAINALVRSSGLTTEEFVAKMNAKVTTLRLEPLYFTEPTGLSSKNVGNVQMVARLLKEALKNDKIYQTLQIGEYYAKPLHQAKPRRVWTTNWLLTNWVPNSFDKDAMAGKTGYTAESDYNFAVRLSDAKGHVLRVVILGAASNETRFSEARDLAEWVFNHYLWPEDAGYNELVE